jgi:hypothetical protein
MRHYTRLACHGPAGDQRTGARNRIGRTVLRVTKVIPAKQFWSLTVYERATWAFIQNPLDRAGLGSFNKDTLKANADGSIDLYFGPKAPDGLESNWIPTMRKEPYLWLRLYAPEEPFWNKTFKMPDVEPVD